MKPLPPDKEKRLLAFLETLPAGAAGKLFAALERDRAAGGSGLPHRLLLDNLRDLFFERDAPFPARPKTAQRLFFTPFEDFFIAHRAGKKRRGRIARASIGPVWSLATTDPACAGAARAAAALDSAIREGSSNIPTFEDALFSAAMQGFGRLIAHAEADAAFRDDLARRLGGAAAFDDFAEIHFLLHAVEPLRTLQAVFPKPVAGLTEEEFFELRRLYVASRGEAPGSGPYLLLALAGRMEDPWRALAVYYHFAGARDEAMADAAADAAIIPETLFEDLESAARLLARDADSDLYAEDTGLRVAHFAAFAEGLAAEAKRAGDKALLYRIEAGRDVAAESLARFTEQSLAALRRAMPVRHAGGSSRLAALRPDYARGLSPRLAAASREAARFLAEAENLAHRLGRPEATAGVVVDAVDAARRYAGDLVTEIRAAEGEDRAAARRLMDHLLDIAAPLLPAGELGLLKERAHAAALTA